MTHLPQDNTDLEPILHGHYQEHFEQPPTSAETWTLIVSRLTQQEQERPMQWWRRVLPWQHRSDTTTVYVPASRPNMAFRFSLRIAIVLMLSIGLLTVSSTAYALLGPGSFDGLLQGFGLKPIASQFTDYHQSKTVDGHTFAIQKAYADANRVIIGYETDPQPNINAKFIFEPGVLTTEQGMKLPGIFGDGAGQSTLSLYDASAIQGEPHDLHLRLAVLYGSFSAQSGFHIVENLHFNLVVPFQSAKKIINLQHAVTASGKPPAIDVVIIDGGKKETVHVVTANRRTLTLERAVITPSETRIYLSGFEFNPTHDDESVLDGSGKALSFSLSVGGQVYSPPEAYEPPSGFWYLSFNTPSHFHTQGLWTLTIQQETRSITGLKPIPGAVWTFPFTVA